MNRFTSSPLILQIFDMLTTSHVVPTMQSEEKEKRKRHSSGSLVVSDVLMSERGTTGSGFEGILKHNSRTQQNLESQVH